MIEHADLDTLPRILLGPGPSDEVTSALDIELIGEVLLAEDVADRVVYMDEGKIV